MNFLFASLMKLYTNIGSMNDIKEIMKKYPHSAYTFDQFGLHVFTEPVSAATDPVPGSATEPVSAAVPVPGSSATAPVVVPVVSVAVEAP
jgi:hypothetical protein